MRIRPVLVLFSDLCARYRRRGDVFLSVTTEQEETNDEADYECDRYTDADADFG